MLPSTSKGHKKSAKIISYQAFDHVVRHLRIGTSVETFYAGVQDSPSSCVLVSRGTTSKGSMSSLITSPFLAKRKHQWQLLMSSSEHTSSSVSTTPNPSTTYTHSFKPRCSTSSLEVPKKIPESWSSEQHLRLKICLVSS